MRRLRPVIVSLPDTPVSYQEFDLFVKRAGGEWQASGRLRPGTALVGLAAGDVTAELENRETGERQAARLEPARLRHLAAASGRLIRRLARRPRSTWRALVWSAGMAGFKPVPVRIVHLDESGKRLSQAEFERMHSLGDSLMPGARRRIANVFRRTGADSVSWDFLVAGREVLRPAAAAALDRYSSAMTRHIAFRAGAAQDIAQSENHVHLSECLGRSQVIQPWTRQGGVPVDDTGVSIVIPTRDAPALLAACLESVEAGLRPQDELILVDHETRDAAALALIEAARDRGARVCREAGAFNFSRLVNAGAALARCPNLVMLNNDVRGLGADWTTVMSGWLARPGIGAVGVDLRYPDGRRQHVGLTLSREGLPAHLEPGRRTDGPLGLYTVPRDVFAVTGACLGIRTGLYREIGGLDEGWPTDFSDIVLCLDVRDRGLSIVWTPDVSGIHDESASRGREPVSDRHRAEWQRVLERHPRLGTADPYAPPRMDRVRLEWAEDWLVL